MPSIEEVLLPGTAIRLEYMNGQGYRITGQSRINCYEGLYLVLDAPKPLYILNDLTLNHNLALICKYRKQPEDYVFFCNYIKNRDTDPPLMMVSKPDGYSLGRKAFRCEVNLPFSYYNNQNEYQEGLMINLSFEGLLAAVKSADSLKLGMDIPLKFQFPTSRIPILIVGKIVRIENYETESRIAVAFSYLSNEIHDAIGRFLSNAQGTTIRKALRKDLP